MPWHVFQNVTVMGKKIIMLIFKPQISKTQQNVPESVHIYIYIFIFILLLKSTFVQA